MGGEGGRAAAQRSARAGAAVGRIDVAPPLSRDELNDLMDYGNERMNSSACSLDPFRREVRATALTDGYFADDQLRRGAYNTIWLAWLVSRQRPYIAHPLRLTLPFQPPGDVPRRLSW